jgi:hypothetical protein
MTNNDDIRVAMEAAAMKAVQARHPHARRDTRALHDGAADGWFRAVHGAGAWRNIWIARGAISALAIDCACYGR